MGWKNSILRAIKLLQKITSIKGIVCFGGPNVEGFEPYSELDWKQKKKKYCQILKSRN